MIKVIETVVVMFVLVAFLLLAVYMSEKEKKRLKELHDERLEFFCGVVAALNVIAKRQNDIVCILKNVYCHDYCDCFDRAEKKCRFDGETCGTKCITEDMSK